MTKSDWQEFKNELRREFKEGFQQSLEQYSHPQHFEEFRARTERQIQSIEEKMSHLQVSVARLETSLTLGNKMLAIVGAASVSAIGALLVKLLMPA